jgi:hypothetical protein
MRPGPYEALYDAWLPDDLTDEEAIWLAGAERDDPDSSYVFAGPPWQVWLDAKAAGESPEGLATLGYHRFQYRAPDNGGWLTETITLAEMINFMPESVVRADRQTTVAESIEDLAADGVLRWDQDSQTAIPGPRLLPILIAEDEENMLRFGPDL